MTRSSRRQGPHFRHVKIHSLTIHPILDSTHRLHACHIAIMNSEAVHALLVKNPSLKASKARLEAMEPGAYCVHRSWGFGQIQEYDEADQKLVIDFKGKAKHRMDPDFCHRPAERPAPNPPPVEKEKRPEKDPPAIQKKPVPFIL